MKNYSQVGKKIDYTSAGVAVKSGDVVVLPSGIGVVVADIAADESGTVLVEEVVELPKEAPLAVVQFAKLYFNAGTGKLTTTAAGNTPAGVAHEAAAEADVTIKCKLLHTAIGQAAVQAASVAADVAAVVADLNGVIAKLKAAGLMANA